MSLEPTAETVSAESDVGRYLRALVANRDAERRDQRGCLQALRRLALLLQLHSNTDDGPRRPPSEQQQQQQCRSSDSCQRTADSGQRRVRAMPIAEVIERARRQGRTVLTEVESKQILHEAGIPVARAVLAATAAEAVKAADDAGYPVVLKIVSPDIAHKSDVGGVKVGLGSAAEVEVAFEEIMASVKQNQPDARIEGVAVQRMAPAGTEVIVGMSKDPQFGPVMMFGLGGIFVEVLKDVAFRIVPLEPRDAREMVREIKGFPVLEGVRGQDPADIEALEKLILKVSEFIEAHPEIEELDLNPVFAYKDGVIAVDARIVVAQ